jgi:uncharacterized circularly permuted ATP-grasp superfamily protein
MPIELTEYDPGPFFDEMMAGKNRARPLSKELIGLFRRMNDGDLAERQAAADLAIKEMGITFTVYNENEGMIDRNWPFDIVPRIIAKQEWDGVEAGLKQRVRALNLFISRPEDHQGRGVSRRGPGRIEELPSAVRRREPAARGLGTHLWLRPGP